MDAKQFFNPFRMTRPEAVWVLMLAGLFLVSAGIGEIRSRRRAGPPVEVVKKDQARYTYKIDLNSASWAELTVLPGVGEVTAKRIVEYREKLGGFKTVGQLAAVRGISKSRLAEIAGLVVLGPPEAAANEPQVRDETGDDGGME